MDGKEQIAHIVSNVKLAGFSAGTFGVGVWTWVGENQSELGGLASIVGIIGVVVAVARGSKRG